MDQDCSNIRDGQSAPSWPWALPEALKSRRDNDSAGQSGGNSRDLPNRIRQTPCETRGDRKRCTHPKGSRRPVDQTRQSPRLTGPQTTSATRYPRTVPRPVRQPGSSCRSTSRRGRNHAGFRIDRDSFLQVRSRSLRNGHRGQDSEQTMGPATPSRAPHSAHSPATGEHLVPLRKRRKAHHFSTQSRRRPSFEFLLVYELLVSGTSFLSHPPGAGSITRKGRTERLLTAPRVHPLREWSSIHTWPAA